MLGGHGQKPRINVSLLQLSVVYLSLVEGLKSSIYVSRFPVENAGQVDLKTKDFPS